MTNGSATSPEAHRRRSQRVILSIPVAVSGETPQGPFSEHTHTLVINAHGALITLVAKILLGQTLLLKSATHPGPQACSVVFVGPTAEGRTQVGVEFTEPAPHFWQVAFPPEDWSVAMMEDPAQPPKPAK